MYSAAEYPERALALAGLDARALAAMSGLAVTEIAGRDSIAAAVTAVRERGFTTLLPTSVATGTEYGGDDAPERATAHLRELLGDDVVVLPHLRLGTPTLWAALNGRFSRVIGERFGIFSPCLACHLYMHLCRTPLARLLGEVPVIAGERDTHGGRVKLSQTPVSIDAAVRVLACGHIELVEPIRHVRDNEEIARLVGAGWTANDRELCCVHSGNYLDVNGEAAYDELAYARYVRGFIEPAGIAVIEAWRTVPEPGYEALVRSVLAGPDAA
jgi:hypothetical protein